MRYVGTELELFRDAANWKRYWTSAIQPHVGGDVLDVGCGLGVNAPFLLNKDVRGYTFLEPDATLLEQVCVKELLPATVHAEKACGTTAEVTNRRFDTVLYADVLEHIADDRMELTRAMDLLLPAGHLIILVPAFQFLYSPFDAAIGHHRRYTKAMVRSRMPSGMRIVSMRYLDSAGMALSLGNRIILRNAAPDKAQIALWDRRVIPVSRWLDPLLGHRFGRSLLAVMQRI